MINIQSVGWNEEKNLIHTLKNSSSEDSSFSLRESFQFRVLDTKTCIGFYDAKAQFFKLCEKNIFEYTKVQCYDCSRKGELFWKNIHSLSQEQRIELSHMSTINYLSVFPGKMLKTGVTLASRKHSRALDQGALYTLFFAETDGVTARYLEEEMTQYLQVKQSFTWKQKIKYLHEIPLQKEAEVLLRKYEQQFSKLPSYSNDISLITDNRFNPIDHYTGLNSIPHSVIYIKQLSPKDIIQGTFQFLYGTLLGFSWKNNTYVIDTRKLLGWDLELLDHHQEQSITITSQEKIELSRSQRLF